MTCLKIQIPWSDLLINGHKSVETRSYPLPKKYEGVELLLIETPNQNSKFKCQIIGTITFSHSFKYPNEKSWKDDYNRHKVQTNDEFYSWNPNKPKYGWVVSKVSKFDNPIPYLKKKGIVFTKISD